MRPVAPRIGFPEVMIAEEQEQYAPLAGAVVEFADGTKAILTRWTLAPDERKRIADGADLYVTHLTFGGPLQAVHLEIGRPSWALPDHG